MKLADLHLRQRDGVSCGPAVAVVAGALLDPGYAAEVGDPSWFAGEQRRVHAATNRVWPRALGTTPWGMARTISGHSAGHHVRYGWRPRWPRDDMADVELATTARWPVAMLVGNAIPRHWVLIVQWEADVLGCYEPSSGAVVRVPRAAVLGSGLTGLGFPRAFAFVLPRRRIP